MLTALIKYLVIKNHGIEKQLRIAKLSKTPEQFFREIINLSLVVGIVVTLSVGLFLQSFLAVSFPFLVLLFVLSTMIAYQYFKRIPQVYIRKRQRDIDREVLFAGRYLLVKVESGMPLLNSLEDAARSYGIASKYFAEIVDDIKTGTPIEEALEHAREHSPSQYFKMILSELITSLRTGVDVSQPLRAILQQITKEQMLEIKEYAKKLNAFVMIYMVLGTVLPSLGMTMFVIVGTFLQINFTQGLAFTFLFIFAFLQYFFIAALRSMRPLVNL